MNSTIAPELARLVKDNLREVPDFPQPGVLFRDMTPLLANGIAFKQLIAGLGRYYQGRVDAVAGLESRGFLLASPLAVEMGVSMLMIRKAGKLPGPLIGVDYTLEYGTARLEIQPDSVKSGSRVLVVDDVLATGGTASAAVKLIEQSGARVEEIMVLMELTELNGKRRIPHVPFTALLRV